MEDSMDKAFAHSEMFKRGGASGPLFQWFPNVAKLDLLTLNFEIQGL